MHELRDHSHITSDNDPICYSRRSSLMASKIRQSRPPTRLQTAQGFGHSVIPSVYLVSGGWSDRGRELSPWTLCSSSLGRLPISLGQTGARVSVTHGMAVDDGACIPTCIVCNAIWLLPIQQLAGCS